MAWAKGKQKVLLGKLKQNPNVPEFRKKMALRCMCRSIVRRDQLVYFMKITYFTGLKLYLDTNLEMKLGLLLALKVNLVPQLSKHLFISSYVPDPQSALGISSEQDISHLVSAKVRGSCLVSSNEDRKSGLANSQWSRMIGRVQEESCQTGRQGQSMQGLGSVVGSVEYFSKDNMKVLEGISTQKWSDFIYASTSCPSAPAQEVYQVC